MCARKMVVIDLAKVREIFEVKHGPTPNFAPRWNLPVTERAPIIRLDQTGQRRLELATWDYRDSSVVSLKGRAPFYNARGESMARSDVFSRQRCLLPCDGFYEWQTIKEPGRKKPKKIPYLFRRQDRQPFAMGGVWSEWKNPEGVDELTYVELTVEPTPLVGEIHNRMPLIIDPSNWQAYLAGPVAEARDLVRPNPLQGFERIAVSSLVNSVKNEGPDILDPANDTEPKQVSLFG